jgi:hypothetical protein
VKLILVQILLFCSAEIGVSLVNCGGVIVFLHISASVMKQEKRLGLLLRVKQVQEKKQAKNSILRM